MGETSEVSMSVEAWCAYWRPPPLPPSDNPLYPQLYNHVKDNENFLYYTDNCGFVPGPTMLPTTVSQAGVSVVTYIMLLILMVAILCLIALGYIWHRHKLRSGRTLPTTEYENTNYLDNKAQQGQCWKPLTESKAEGIHQCPLTAEPNDYLSLPRIGGKAPTAVIYMKSSNHNGECHVQGETADTEFNSMGKVGSDAGGGDRGVGEGDSGDVYNYSEMVGNGGGLHVPSSPSISSNTPLYRDEDFLDSVLGSNTPLYRDEDFLDSVLGSGQATNTTFHHEVFQTIAEHTSANSLQHSNSSSHSVDKTVTGRPVQYGGVEMRVSRLPPIDVPDSAARRCSDSSVRSPSRKKPSYLLRKSATPIEAIKDSEKAEVDCRKSM